MSRMPREHDPEWMWRARAWAAWWKVVVLVLIGVAFGAYFMWLQFYYLHL